MGKYMQKSKLSGDNGVMEGSTEPTSFGVRTRAAAKTLALKRLNSSASDSSCYLQLRSRRLEKPTSLVEPKQPPRHHKSGIKESGSKVASDSVIVSQSCNSLDFETRQSIRESMVPTTSELEEFFAYAEQQQQRLFMEKYNFDVVNDVPLPGRYEWVQVSP